MDFSRMSDEELIRIFQKNQPLPQEQQKQEINAAFETLWGRHKKSAEKMIYSHWHLVPKGYYHERFFRDVTSQVAYKLTRYLLSGHSVESFRGLLKTVVYRTVIEERRKVIRNLRREVPFDPEPNVEKEAASEQIIDAIMFRSRLYNPTPQQILEEEDRCRIVWTALDLLAADKRLGKNGLNESKSLELHFMKGWTLEEIAEHFKKSKRQVQRWIGMGLVHLKEVLQTRFHIDNLEDI